MRHETEAQWYARQNGLPYPATRRCTGHNPAGLQCTFEHGHNGKCSPFYTPEQRVAIAARELSTEYGCAEGDVADALSRAFEKLANKLAPDFGPFCSHCGGDRQQREPADRDGLGCIENIYHSEEP